MFSTLNWKSVVFCALSLAACDKHESGSDVKNVFGKDDRVSIRTHDYPYRAISKLINGDGGECTATLVSHQLAVTAAHCVFGNDGELTKLTVYPNYIDGESVMSASASYVYYGTKNPQQYRVNDWAILILNKKLGDIYGAIGVLNRNVDNFPNAFFVAGYSGDFNNGETAGISWGVNRGAHGGLIYHDSDTAPGASGGPVLGVDSNGDLYIAGIHVAGNRPEGSNWIPVYDDEHANIAVPSSQLSGRLQSLLDAGY